MAAAFKAALAESADRGGMAATVMSADGTWAGTAGQADGVRDLRIEDQFNIGSVNKSLVAAQVMQLVEAGELDLDASAADHLPAHLDFDTNGATIRQLLSHRSGIPDYWSPAFEKDLTMNPRRVWTTEELLQSIPDARGPVEDAFVYSSTNYVLLGLVIEHVRGRPLVEVLRDGVLDVPGTERLISQPEERPTAPMAMPSASPPLLCKRRRLPPIHRQRDLQRPGGRHRLGRSLPRSLCDFCAVSRHLPTR
jgi:CubicO group peptidase (beta-lactamase class C family)